MSDINGFRAYESAIINGLIASGNYSTAEIRSDLKEIRETARKFSGSVSDILYPVGVHWMETDAAKECVLHLLKAPAPLGHIMRHLQDLGFNEPVARYAYSALIDDRLVNMVAVDGVPMLSREVSA